MLKSLSKHIEEKHYEGGQAKIQMVGLFPSSNRWKTEGRHAFTCHDFSVIIKIYYCIKLIIEKVNPFS